MKINIFFFLISVSLISGCASSTKTYGPSGEQAYSLNCSGTVRNWGMCFEKAGEICKSRGYKIINATTDSGTIVSATQGQLFATTTRARTMLISCN